MRPSISFLVILSVVYTNVETQDNELENIDLQETADYPDWEQYLSDGYSTLCRRGCSHGDCIKLNTCKCHEGWRGNNCNSATCMDGCTHGACIGPNICKCHNGYRGTNCNSAVCPNCVNGRCIRPNICLCNFGWSGKHCQILASCSNDNTCGNNGHTCRRECNAGEEIEYLFRCSLYSCICCKKRKQPDPICTGGCSHGACIRTNTCNCHNGWKGTNCNTATACSNKNTCGDNGHNCRRECKAVEEIEYSFRCSSYTCKCCKKRQQTKHKSCKDKYSWCKDHKNDCASSKFIAKGCKETCGLCQSTDIVPDPDSNCKDEYAGCVGLKNRCRSSPQVMKMCSKTCGTCNKDESCKDENIHCKYNTRHCASSQSIAKICKKTCGQCQTLCNSTCGHYNDGACRGSCSNSEWEDPYTHCNGEGCKCCMSRGGNGVSVCSGLTCGDNNDGVGVCRGSCSSSERLHSSNQCHGDGCKCCVTRGAYGSYRNHKEDGETRHSINNLYSYNYAEQWKRATKPSY